MAALLHDVGHLPFGHTLEDELNHLPSHDGPERLRRVATIPYPHYDIDRQKEPTANASKPEAGWTLEALVNHFYSQCLIELNIANSTPFSILTYIVCKPPKDPDLKLQWDEGTAALNKSMMLRVCQDIVANTICADFLDYLHRDWYHLGKPLYSDKRLYQYMEVRQAGSTDASSCRFVINAGASEKIRHDAFTDILSLLNERYKLAQTVLFHRTKLALTGLLDRCLLEISDLYGKAKFPREKFLELAERHLLSASDDGMPLILDHLARGGDSSGREAISQAIEKENKTIEQQAASHQTNLPMNIESTPSVTTPLLPHLQLIEPLTKGELGSQQALALKLIDRLRDREVYSLVYKLRISDLPGVHTPANEMLQKLVSLYKQPANRLLFLRGIEVLCGFPQGSLIMNCPSDPTMNAKVAKVSLFVEGRVTEFDKYEESQGETSLTRRALEAQVNRFYELWAASIYMDRHQWDALSSTKQKLLRMILAAFFFTTDSNADPNLLRMQMQSSIDVFQMKASQAGTEDPSEEAWRTFVFPSGLPFLPKDIDD